MKPVRDRLILCFAAALLTSTAAFAQNYQFKVVAQGLNRPTGIAVHGGNTVYFTEIPTPGAGGGANAVKELKLGNGAIRTLHQGEPEPVNIAVDKSGILYWTCKSAGVILEQAPHQPAATAAALLTGLAQPSGIAIDYDGFVYFTQLPTPGVSGNNGGTNSVSVVSTGDNTDVGVVSQGEPEPVDIAASRDGDIYWTCKSAGVILTRDADGEISLLLGGLTKPVGIALDEKRHLLFWTEVPTPGVSGLNGGSNKVWSYNLRTQAKTLVHSGDPEPTDIAVASNGRVYWTCTSAGVIVEAKRN